MRCCTRQLQVLHPAGPLSSPSPSIPVVRQNGHQQQYTKRARRPTSAVLYQQVCHGKQLQCRGQAACQARNPTQQTTS